MSKKNNKEISNGVKNLCIIQARTGSTRLPGKVLKEIAGVPMLEYQVNRLKQAKRIDKIVIATTTNSEDDRVEQLCRKLKIDCFRGSVDDVLDRYYQCIQNYSEYDSIIRITGDCPLVDPKVVDQVISLFEKGDYDYANNVQPDTFPDGMDVEIFKRSVIEQSAKQAKSDFEREHLNEYVLNNKNFSKGNLKAETDYSDYRLTVDNQEDFEVIEFLIKNSQPDSGYLDYVLLLDQHPEVRDKNAHIKRNEYAFRPIKNKDN